MFNDRRFTSNSLNYSYFSKKYHNYYTFTLAFGLIILTLWHLINVLINWKFVSRFFPDLKGALLGLRQFLATESPLKMMKNGFCFTLKAFFVLEIFKFLSCLFGHVEKRLD